MNESEAIRTLEKALGLAEADAVVAALSGASEASTRIAENAITQNVQRDTVSLRVDCAYGASHGSAATSDLSDGSLKALVRRAQKIARVSPPDPEYMPPVEAAETGRHPKVEAFFEGTLGYDPRAKARDLGAAAASVAAEGLRLSGAYASGSQFRAVANSAGLRAYHRRTGAAIRVTVLGPTGSGWAQKTSNDTADIRVQEVVDAAARIARESADPGDSEPGRYTAILSPAAVSDLLVFLFPGLDAKAADEGRSPLRGRLGKKVCGADFTLRSDPSDARCPGTPFQDDGLRSPSLAWILGGVLENLIHSRFWARKQGRQPTGAPSNVIVEGGETTVEEMIASTGRGVLITRFWYNRFVDPMVPLVTGMTRDGLFLIEKGRIAKPIRQMRYNERILDLLGRVEAMSPPERVGDRLVPAMKVRDFHFTSTTKF